MTSEERWAYFNTGVLQSMTAIELLDWAGYWTMEGVDSIENALLKQQTKIAIDRILTDLGYMNKVVSNLAISYEEIQNAPSTAAITQSMIHSIVVNIMATRISWLTDLFELPEEY